MNYKAIIAPFVAVIVIVAQLVFGFEIDEEIVSEFTMSLANMIAVCVVVYGLLKAQMNKGKPNMQK